MLGFLTDFSSGQPVLWALFVLGVVGAVALVLTLWWAGVFRVGAMIGSLRKKSPRTD